MEETIDKVARAIFAAVPKHTAATYDDLTPEMQDYYRKIARAAVEAMTRPIATSPNPES